MRRAVTFGGKWQVLPELPGRFDGIIWQGDRRGGRMVDELERSLEIDLRLLRWCKVVGFVRCSVGGAGAALETCEIPIDKLLSMRPPVGLS